MSNKQKEPQTSKLKPMAEQSAVGFFTFRTNMRWMMQTKNTSNKRAAPGLFRVRKDPVKLTALLYLRDALLAEKYEECAEFIAIAREFGAQTFEVQNILEDPKRAL